MLSLVNSLFGWLPIPLAALVSCVVGIFGIIVAFAALKLIVDICVFLAQIVGGVFAKIASLFV